MRKKVKEANIVENSENITQKIENIKNISNHTKTREYTKNHDMKIHTEDNNVSFSTNNVTNNHENNSNKINRNNRNIMLSIILTFVACLSIFLIFYKFYLKDLVIETTRIEKDVTVTDKGIADAVENVYDSVVVIENYVNNKVSSSGTGFVFKTDDNYGYILTNSHVVSDSKSIYVTFTNNEKVEATLLGSDDYSDIAVLQVDKSVVTKIAEIADVSTLRVGDTTFTVGAPLDSSVYSWTVTRGILSGKERLVEVTINNSNYVMEVLQTDAAINSGNSGGPLCNSNGEVIGITNMKIASSTIEGMGFAIPIDIAVKYANSIISGKSISRPYLGVSVYDASNNIFSNSTGIYVEYVQKNSAADKAGIEKGDKILKINDIDVTSSAYFKYQLYKYEVGDKITIIIERNGNNKEINVTLGSLNDVN